MIPYVLLWGCVACESPSSDSGDPPGTAQAPPPIASAPPDGPIAPGERVPRPAPESTSDPSEQGEEQAKGPDPTAAPNPVAALSRLAQRHASGWIAASDAFEATLQPGGSQDYQLVLTAAHCYRVLAVGERELEDLDLLLFDPAGVQVQQDTAQDRFPVLGLSYPVCPPAAGAYRLQVRAVQGAGSARIQAFHSPRGVL